MEIEIELETERFKNIVKAVSINGIIETPTLQFQPNQLKAINKDLASVVLSYSIFKSKYFIKYGVETDYAVGFESQRLLRIAKQLSGEVATIRLNSDKDEIEIFTKSREVAVPTVESVIKRAEIPSFVKEGENGVETDASFMMSEKIQILKRELESLGELETTFMLSNGELSVKQESVDGYRDIQKLKNGIACTDFSVISATSYLSTIFDSVICEEVELKLSKDFPIVVLDKTADYNILLVLAPKVE